MFYADGLEAFVGDSISLSEHGPRGIIVGDIEAGAYAKGYVASDWAYLGKGLLVLLIGSTQAVLINDLDEDTFLVNREDT